MVLHYLEEERRSNQVFGALVNGTPTVRSKVPEVCEELTSVTVESWSLGHHFLAITMHNQGTHMGDCHAGSSDFFSLFQNCSLVSLVMPASAFRRCRLQR